METSGQKQVFDWLLKHRSILDGSDNSLLYKTFRNSGLSRNRLRSYKSRLREKVKKGEFDPIESNKQVKPETHFYWHGIAIALCLAIAGLVFYFLLRRPARWLSTLFTPATEETEEEEEE